METQQYNVLCQIHTNTHLSCFSATASRSASGSLAKTTVAPSLPASANDRVYKTQCQHFTVRVCDRTAKFIVWSFVHTRTPSPSSGLGYLTVGNSGSGSFCSSTANGAGRSKALKAACTKAWPTPCTDVCTIFTSELLFTPLKKHRSRQKKNLQFTKWQL